MSETPVAHSSLGCRDGGAVMTMNPPWMHWTKEQCAKEALTYQTRKDFDVSNPWAYATALEKGWLDDVCQHMNPRRKPVGYWTKERCAEEARLYQTRKAFQTGNLAAYRAAQRHGWLDDICQHMEPGDGQAYMALPTKLYYLRVERWGDDPLYKIGITSRDKIVGWRGRFCLAEDQDRITILDQVELETGADALAVEQELLREFAADRYDGPPVLLGNGNSELFARGIFGGELRERCLDVWTKPMEKDVRI